MFLLTVYGLASASVAWPEARPSWPLGTSCTFLCLNAFRNGNVDLEHFAIVPMSGGGFIQARYSAIARSVLCRLEPNSSHFSLELGDGVSQTGAVRIRQTVYGLRALLACRRGGSSVHVPQMKGRWASGVFIECGRAHREEVL